MSETALVVMTTNAADASAVAAWLRAQLPAGDVRTVSGFYAGSAIVAAGPRAVVVDIGVPDERLLWQLAEFRSGRPDAVFAVVADTSLLRPLSGPLRADVAVPSVDRLPPLRELLLEPVDPQAIRPQTIGPQTIWRRTTR